MRQEMGSPGITVLGFDRVGVAERRLVLLVRSQTVYS